MLKKLILTMSVLLILGGCPFVQAASQFNISFNELDLSGRTTIFPNQADWEHKFLVKSGVAYDEAKDPAMRQGTENWEEPQGSFFIVPALILGVIGLILFFNRK